MRISRRRAVGHIALLGTVACCGCHTTPITGRKQLLLMPEQSELALGLSTFEEVTSSEPASTNQHYVQMVQRVGNRIAAVADRQDYEWDFRVIASPIQNAFCLPGGKVLVYEGILPVCATEAGLAVVLSHEIAHALARHGGERMSHQYAVDSMKQAVDFVTRQQNEARKETFMKAYGLASKYGVIMPYSRKHESEADHMGLLLMAEAGYDPTEAPRFWDRFATATQGGSQPPEFLSTHPANERRAADLKALLPEALALYEKAPHKFGQGETIQIAPLQVTAQLQAPTSMPQGFFPDPAGPATAGRPQQPNLPAPGIQSESAGIAGEDAEAEAGIPVLSHMWRFLQGMGPR